MINRDSTKWLIDRKNDSVIVWKGGGTKPNIKSITNLWTRTQFIPLAHSMQWYEEYWPSKRSHCHARGEIIIWPLSNQRLSSYDDFMRSLCKHQLCVCVCFYQISSIYLNPVFSGCIDFPFSFRSDSHLAGIVLGLLKLEQDEQIGNRRFEQLLWMKWIFRFNSV